MVSRRRGGSGRERSGRCPNGANERTRCMTWDLGSGRVVAGASVGGGRWDGSRVFNIRLAINPRNDQSVVCGDSAP